MQEGRPRRRLSPGNIQGRRRDFGNIIFGGGIGALIDHNKGTGYNYPDELPVKMGSATTVDRNDEVRQSSSTSSEERVAQSKN